MLIDLLGLDNYAGYNIKIANTLGLHCAVYLSELLNINEKAVRKNKINNGYFIIDRAYITKRTTLDATEQIKLDEMLSNIGIITIDKDDNSCLQLNLSVLISLVNENNEDMSSDLKKLKQSLDKAKGSKEQQQCALMKSYITTTNPELYKAYCDWIDSVYAKLHWMSKKAVEFGQRLVDEKSNHDLDVALKIVELATVNGYKDMSWAVRLYEENYKPSFRIVNSSNQSSNRAIKDDLGEEIF